MTDDQVREDAVRAMLEGIASAHYAVKPMIMITPDNFATMAHAALASLESAGLKVVRDA